MQQTEQLVNSRKTKIGENGWTNLPQFNALGTQLWQHIYIHQRRTCATDTETPWFWFPAVAGSRFALNSQLMNQRGSTRLQSNRQGGRMSLRWSGAILGAGLILQRHSCGGARPFCDCLRFSTSAWLSSFSRNPRLPGRNGRRTIYLPSTAWDRFAGVRPMARMLESNFAKESFFVVFIPSSYDKVLIKILI